MHALEATLVTLFYDWDPRRREVNITYFPLTLSSFFVKATFVYFYLGVIGGWGWVGGEDGGRDGGDRFKIVVCLSWNSLCKTNRLAYFKRHV